ncbi:Putative permease [Clostridium chauvoei JF4335]|nr:Putative permease [Clostridium chauvoei JF4335]
MEVFMFGKNIKHKDLIVSIVIAIVMGIIGYKIIDNYQYFFGVLGKLLSLCVPFIYGLVIAYILNPLVKRIERKFKLKKGLAILTTYAILIGVIALISFYCIPNIVESAIDLTKDIPSYITEMQNGLNNLLSNESIKDLIVSTGTMESVNRLISQVGTVAVTLLEGSISYAFSISSNLMKFVLGIMISVYVLVDKERLIAGTKRILFIIFKKEKSEKIIEFVRIYNHMIGTYIGIKAIDSSIIGGLAFILLNLVKSEYAVLLACIVAITNMIPYFGPFIGEIVGFLFNVFVSPTKGILTFLVLLSLQLFDGWYLDPKLIGSKVGVRPFFIILGVVVGGGFFGPVGMLLASPTVATIKIYITRLMDKNKELVEMADKA